MIIETEHEKWKSNRWDWLLNNMATLIINSRKSLMTSTALQLITIIWTLVLELCVLVPGCFMLIWTDDAMPTAVKCNSKPM